MQIGTAPASFKDILSKKEAVEAKLDELDQHYVKQKSKTKTHLRNSSALSAADISVTLPFGICKKTNACETQQGDNKEDVKAHDKMSCDHSIPTLTVKKNETCVSWSK